MRLWGEPSAPPHGGGQHPKLRCVVGQEVVKGCEDPLWEWNRGRRGLRQPRPSAQVTQKQNVPKLRRLSLGF